MISSDQLKEYYPFNNFEDKFFPLLINEVKAYTLHKGAKLYSANKKSKFTKFLLKGEVHIKRADGREKTIKSTSLQSKYPLGDGNKRNRFDAVVNSAQAEVFRINSTLLDHFRVWNNLYVDSSPDSPLRGHDSYDWVIGLLKSRTVQMLPEGHIDQIFKQLSARPVQQGEEVISEGEAGNYCYIIADGTADVYKCQAEGEAKVASLGKGALFGETALISKEPRNASVRMSSNGLLMCLPGEQFSALLKSHVVRWVTAETTLEKIASGATLLDVREPDEFQNLGIQGVMNIPITRLRENIKHLDKTREIVTCSQLGSRSATAAFLLATKGYDVYALQGGINSLLRALDI